jgi:hypothetical protein
MAVNPITVRKWSNVCNAACMHAMGCEEMVPVIRHGDVAPCPSFLQLIVASWMIGSCNTSRQSRFAWIWCPVEDLAGGSEGVCAHAMPTCRLSMHQHLEASSHVV